MTSRCFPPFLSDDAAELRRAASAAAGSLGCSGWWSPERVAAAMAAVEEIGRSSSSSSLLSLADLLDSAADYMDRLVANNNSGPGSIYSGDAGVAYALIRQGSFQFAAAAAAGGVAARVCAAAAVFLLFLHPLLLLRLPVIFCSRCSARRPFLRLPCCCCLCLLNAAAAAAAVLCLCGAQEGGEDLGSS